MCSCSKHVFPSIKSPETLLAVSATSTGESSSAKARHRLKNVPTVIDWHALSWCSPLCSPVHPPYLPAHLVVSGSIPRAIYHLSLFCLSWCLVSVMPIFFASSVIWFSLSLPLTLIMVLFPDQQWLAQSAPASACMCFSGNTVMTGAKTGSNTYCFCGCMAARKHWCQLLKMQGDSQASGRFSEFSGKQGKAGCRISLLKGQMLLYLQSLNEHGFNNRALGSFPTLAGGVFLFQEQLKFEGALWAGQMVTSLFPTHRVRWTEQ